MKTEQTLTEMCIYSSEFAQTNDKAVFILEKGLIDTLSKTSSNFSISSESYSLDCHSENIFLQIKFGEYLKNEKLY
ncbi:MAG: hypothetical protein WCH52_04000 [Bacteroidota bacterium]